MCKVTVFIRTTETGEVGMRSGLGGFRSLREGVAARFGDICSVAPRGAAVAAGNRDGTEYGRHESDSPRLQ